MKPVPWWAVPLLTQIVLAAQAPWVYALFGLTLQAVVTNLFLLLPSLALERLCPSPLPWPHRVLVILGGALGTVLVVICVRAAAATVVPLPLSSWSFWAGYATVVELLWAATLRWGRRGRLPCPWPSPWVLLVGVCTFALVSWGSTRVVPPQQDQDMVLICPTEGLFTSIAPYGIETRYPYQFNKPLALYLLTGASIVLRGELEEARPFSDSGREALRFWATEPRARKDRVSDMRDRDIARFYAHPSLTSSVRIPTRGIAVLLALTVFHFCAHVGIRPPLAAGFTAAFVSLPEVFIRSSFAGFTTISLLELMLTLWLFLWEGAPRRRGWLCGASFLLAVTNHKLLFIVPALVLADLPPFRGTLPGWTARWAKKAWTTGVAAGGLAGTAAHLL